MRFKPIITGLLILLINNIQAQEKYFFEKLSVSDGLSNSVVLCTYQDHLGFLWIGTLDGLNRYDGYDIKVYKSIQGDSTSLVRNQINSITEDSDGNLWVGSSDHVTRYNRQTDNFTNYPIDKGFIKTLKYGLKDCSGIAIGMERLAMVFAGVDSIEELKLVFIS